MILWTGSHWEGIPPLNTVQSYADGLLFPHPQQSCHKCLPLCDWQDQDLQVVFPWFLHQKGCCSRHIEFWWYRVIVLVSKMIWWIRSAFSSPPFRQNLQLLPEAPLSAPECISETDSVQQLWDLKGEQTINWLLHCFYSTIGFFARTAYYRDFCISSKQQYDTWLTCKYALHEIHVTRAYNIVLNSLEQPTAVMYI